MDYWQFKKGVDDGETFLCTERQQQESVRIHFTDAMASHHIRLCVAAVSNMSIEIA